MLELSAILLGALLTAGTSLALGRVLLRAAAVKLYREEQGPIALVCGSAVLSLAVFLLCVVRLASPLSFSLLAAGVFGVAWRLARRAPAERLPPLPVVWKLFYAVLFAAYVYVYLPIALAPEVSPDGTTYHLGLVWRYLREGGFVPIRDNMYAQLSQGIEMLFLFAFAFGKHSAAALVHFTFLLVLPLLMVCYARRFGFGPAGLCAAFLVFASPIAGIDGTAAYIDVAVAAVVFTVFYLVQVWRHSGRSAGSRWFALIGLMAGFCFAVKYTAFLAFPYALAVILLSRGRRPLRAVTVVSAAAAISIAPWVLKNWLTVGNPVAPLLNSVFINPYMHAGFDREYSSYLSLYELNSRAEIPFAVTTTGGGGIAGVLGPIFLVAPLGLMALRWPAGRQLWLAALIIGAAYPLNVGTRFLLPVLPFVALALSLALSSIRFAAPAIAALHAVLSWPTIVPRYADPFAWMIPEIPWKIPLGRETREGFLHRRLPGYGAAQLMEQHVPPGERVFAFSGAAKTYTSHEIVTRYQSAFGKNIGTILWTPVIADFQPNWHIEFRWVARPLRRIRIFQTATHPTDYWSIAEFRVRHGDIELRRRPEWRIRAWPNSHEIGFAFDNSPLTRWSTWQPLFTGMYAEVDFGRDEIVDSVRLEASHDQYGIRLKLDGRYPDGHWQALSDGDIYTDAELPPNMRRTATRDVKDLGIGYLLIQDSDYEAADYQKRAAEWGLTELGEHRGIRLYRIE